MQRLLLTFCAVSTLVIAGIASAATVDFERNNDTITSAYNAWICETLNCVVLKSSSTLREEIVIPQTAVGVKPSFTIDLTGKSGSIAISAKRLSGEESALSVPANFTAQPATVAVPGVPTGVAIQ